MSIVPAVLASIGAFLSMVSNIPQVWKVRKLHTTDDLHSYSILIHVFAACLWSIYGFMLDLYILGGESLVVCLLWVLIGLAIVRDRFFFPKNTDGELPLYEK